VIPTQKNIPFPGIAAFDLDGTLLRSDHSISVRTAGALKELEKRGCVPVISTGRNYQGTKIFLEQLTLHGPVITSNGAMISDSRNGGIVHQWPLPDDISRWVYLEARRRKIHFQGFGYQNIYFENKGREAEYYEDITGLTGVIVNFDEWEEFNFIKALLIGPPDRPSGEWPELYAFQRDVQEKFGDRLYHVFSRPHYLDLMSGGCSKGIALEQISRDLSVGRSRVAAFGDALNDLEMLEFAGISVAMKNAHPELRERCSHVTGYSNDDDGVADFIEKMFL
jgi:Cof subfamily protein (haloacid dehalogenase superfamily)